MYSHHLPISKPLVRLIIAALIALTAQFTCAPNSYSAPNDLYVTDLASGSVVRYEPDGTAHTFATGLTSPQGITFNGRTSQNPAFFYVADAGDGGATSGVIWRYDVSGNRTLFA